MAQGTYDVMVPYEGNTLQEQYLKMFKVRSDFNADLLNKVLRTDMGFKHHYIQIPHKVLPFNRIQLKTLVSLTTNADIDLVFYDSAIYPTNIKRGQHLQHDGEDFIAKAPPVRDASAGTLTVSCQRGTNTIFNSTAKAHAADEWFLILAEVVSDVYEFNSSDHVIGTKQVAYCQQIIGFELAVADNSAPLEEISASGDYSVQKQLDDGMNTSLSKLAITAWNNTHAAGTPSNANSNIADKRQLTGWGNWLVRYNGYRPDSSSATLIPSMIDSDLQELKDRGFDNAFPNATLTMLVSHQQLIINQWNNSRIRVISEDQSNKYIQKVSMYDGILPVKILQVSRDYCPVTSYRMCVLEEQFEVGPMNGMAFYAEKLAKTGTVTKYMIHGDYGSAFYLPELAAERYGLAVAA